MNKRILFNLVMTLFFILLAIVSIFLNFDYLIGILGLGILTIILLFGIIITDVPIQRVLIAYPTTQKKEKLIFHYIYFLLFLFVS